MSFEQFLLVMDGSIGAVRVSLPCLELCRRVLPDDICGKLP
ncbi:MAG: hypothetical protein U0694_08740 [Anaerolineae bacterium]